MIVGQAPGEEEDDVGKCFIGPAGQMLTDGLKQHRIQGRIRLENVNRCFPPGNRKPRKDEQEACWPYLQDVIERARNLKVIVALGGAALEALTRHYFTEKLTSITRWHSRFLPEKINGVPVFALFHTSYVLRKPRMLADLENGMETLARWLRKESPPERTQFVWLRTVRQLTTYLQDHSKKLMSVDFETTGLDPNQKKIRLLGFSDESGRAAIAVIEKMGRNWHGVLKKWFESSQPKTAHGLSFEYRWCLVHGIQPEGFVHDTMIMHHLLHEESSHKLETVAGSMVNMLGYADEMRSYLASGGTYADAPLKILGPYCAGDVDAVIRLVPKLQDGLRREKLLKLYRQIEIPVAVTLARTMQRGMRISPMRCRGLIREQQNEADGLLLNLRTHPAVKKLEAKLQKKKNEKRKKPVKWENLFNPGSNSQLSQLLYDVLKIKPLKVTGSGRGSVDNESLTSLSEIAYKNKVLIDDLIAHRKCLDTKTILTTKILDRQQKGYLRTSYQQAFVVTGRLSSREPNLQNVRKGGIERSLFISRFGADGIIMEADYEQLELRLVAEEAHDTVMAGCFERGEDIHMMTACKIFGRRPDQITKEQRDIAKRVNFGRIYLAGPKELSLQIGCSYETAERYVFEWKKLYRATAAYIMRVQIYAKKRGYIIARSGRRRHLPGLRDPDLDRMDEIRMLLQAGNFPVANFDCELTKLAMTLTDQELITWKLHSVVIGQIHDCLILDVLRSEEMEVCKILRRCMLKRVLGFFGKMSVPLAIKIETGPDWGHMKSAVVKRIGKRVAADVVISTLDAYGLGG